MEPMLLDGSGKLNWLCAGCEVPTGEGLLALDVHARVNKSAVHGIVHSINNRAKTLVQLLKQTKPLLYFDRMVNPTSQLYLRNEGIRKVESGRQVHD